MSAAHEFALECLHAGVPVSLLADLAAPEGPASEEIYERETADTSWIPAAPCP